LGMAPRTRQAPGNEGKDVSEREVESDTAEWKCRLSDIQELSYPRELLQRLEVPSRWVPSKFVDWRRLVDLHSYFRGFATQGNWQDAEISYYALASQRRIFDELIVTPLKHIRETNANEMGADEINRIITAGNGVHQSIINAFAELYIRSRPLWKPRSPEDLPAPFCPLALAIQKDTSFPVRPITPPKNANFSYIIHWICPQCSGVVEKATGISGIKDPLRAPFVGHLQAAKSNEKVKYACPTCYKLFENFRSFNSHLFKQKWGEIQWCGAPPPERMEIKWSWWVQAMVSSARVRHKY
jgi:hypothetical protein